MKISVFGMLPFSHLIKEGLEKLGHEISGENPELIYANDPRGYKEAILVKTKYKNVVRFDTLFLIVSSLFVCDLWFCLSPCSVIFLVQYSTFIILNRATHQHNTESRAIVMMVTSKQKRNMSLQ